MDSVRVCDPSAYIDSFKGKLGEKEPRPTTILVVILFIDLF